MRTADGIRVGEAAPLDNGDAQRGQKVTADEVRDREVWSSVHTRRRWRWRRADGLARRRTRTELHVPEIAASERQVVSVPGGPHAREPLDARDQIRGEPQC